MFGFVRPVTFDAFGTLNAARKGRVAPFPTILALWNSWVHVRTTYGGDVVPNVEAPVNE